MKIDIKEVQLLWQYGLSTARIGAKCIKPHDLDLPKRAKEPGPVRIGGREPSELIRES